MSKLNPDGAIFRLNETYIADVGVTCVGAMVPIKDGEFVVEGRVPDTDPMKSESVAKIRSDVIREAINRLDAERQRLQDLLEEHDSWELLDSDG